MRPVMPITDACSLHFGRGSGGSDGLGILACLKRCERAESSLRLDVPEAARHFFAAYFAECQRAYESLWVAHVDHLARCAHLSRHQGDEVGLEFPLRSIIVDAAVHGSAGLILAHNHPSGDSTPSAEDCRATRHLAFVAGALGCRVLDHLVFAGTECTSLRDLGLL